MKDLTCATRRSETLSEEVHMAVLPGGLPVYVCPKPGFRKMYACYSAFYGSVDSTFRQPGEDHPVQVPEGIAHFLEHTLFETSEGNVSDRFSRNGAYNNAATSFAATTYMFASSNRFFDNLGLLVDFVENPFFEAERIEKEKGIIEQEILRYKDDPGWVGYMGLLESLFVEHPIRIDIAGTAESIRKIDSQALHRCYRTFYHPRNMILFAIGDLDRDEVFRFVAERSRAGKPFPEGPLEQGSGSRAIERIYPDEPTRVDSESFEEKMEVALPKLLTGFKEVGVPLKGRDLLMKEMTAEFALDMLFGRGSDAFLRMYLSQLILDDFSVSYYTCAGVGCAVLGGDTPDPDRLRRELERIVSEVRDRGLSEEDFRREKRKFIGSFVRCFNSLEFIASHYTLYRFYELELFEVVDAMESISLELVEERIRELLDPGRMAISVILPVK